MFGGFAVLRLRAPAKSFAFLLELLILREVKVRSGDGVGTAWSRREVGERLLDPLHGRSSRVVTGYLRWSCILGCIRGRSLRREGGVGWWWCVCVLLLLLILGLLGPPTGSVLTLLRQSSFLHPGKGKKGDGDWGVRRKATEVSTWVLRSRTLARRHLHPKNASSERSGEEV